MPENDSFPPKLTSKQLAQILPSDWIHYSEISRPIRRRVYRAADAVVIKKSRMNIPLKAWERLGKPTNINCFFKGYDVYIAPSVDGLRVLVGKTWAYIPFESKDLKFSPYTVRNVYPPERHCIENIAGIPFLRVMGASFTHVDRKWLTHWTKL